MSKNTAQKKVIHKPRPNRKGRPLSSTDRDSQPLAKLVSAQKELGYILNLLHSLRGFVLKPELYDSNVRLKNSCVTHARRAVGRLPIDNAHVNHLSGLAVDLTEDLFSVFEAFVGGVFTHCDNMMSRIRRESPEFLEEQGSEIASLQAALRTQINAGEDSSNEGIVAAFNALVEKFEDLQVKSKASVEERIADMDASLGAELLEVLEAA